MLSLKILLSIMIKPFLLCFGVLFLGMESNLVNAQCTAKDLYVQHDSSWTYQSLQLIPFRYKTQGIAILQGDALGSRYISFADAMKSGKVKVSEWYSNNDADVHVLTVKNNSQKTVLIREGDLLLGGKQDRMSAETKLVPPGKSSVFLNVFCVEAGRWDTKARPFTAGGSADAALRHIMDTSQRQSAIWKAIEKMQTGKSSSTANAVMPYRKMVEKLADSGKYYTAYFLKKFAQSDSSYAGFLAISGDKILGCELFSSSAFTNVAFEGLLNSFIVSAIRVGATPILLPKQVDQYLKPLIESEPSQKKFLENHGKAYYYQNRLVHLVAFGS